MAFRILIFPQDLIKISLCDEYKSINFSFGKKSLKLMNWVDFFGKKNVISWLALYLSFYRNPKKFFKKFLNLQENEKFLITLFLLILVILFHTFTRRLDYKEITLYFIFQIFLTFQVIFLLLITQWILRKGFHSKKVSFQHLFYFTTLSILLTNPIVEFLNYLFLNSQHYVYSIINNIVMGIIVYFIYIYSNWIFYQKKRHIFLGVVLNLTLLNLFVVLRNENIISSHDTKPGPAGDLVIYARSSNMITENSLLFKKFPVSKVVPDDKLLIIDLEEPGRNYLIYSYRYEQVDSFLSSLPKRIMEDFQNRKKIKSQIKYLENVRNFQYKHNTILGNEILKLYRLIDEEVNTTGNKLERPKIIEGFIHPEYMEK